MRSGHWRGRSLAVAFGFAVAAGLGLPARADLFHHAIPGEVPAMDYRTGEQMYAPPIPAGHYTKDFSGCVKGAAGLTFGSIHGLASKVRGLCSRCGAPSCNDCGGRGLSRGKSCLGCGGDGCGRCGSGLGGLLHHKGSNAGVVVVEEAGHGHLHGGPGLSYVGHGATGLASTQMVTTVPTKLIPSVAPSSQMPVGVCGGCLGTGKLLQGGGCGACGGSGLLRNLFHGHGAGVGACGGDPSRCNGQGCGFGHGGLGLGSRGDNGACRGCGGRGCALCSKVRGLLAKICHKGEIKYFVGPGGPVPITPGYVPYVNVTRSPRDFFAFPPFSDQFP